MKIRMLTGIAGTDFALTAGDETERFSVHEAWRMIDADMAEAVGPTDPRPEPEPEPEVEPEPEPEVEPEPEPKKAPAKKTKAKA